MQKKTENKIRMFNAVWQVLLNFIQVWQTNLGFKEVTDDLDKGIKAINTARTPADVSTNGITDDKEVIYDDLIDTMMEISGPLSTIAKRTGNKELQSKVWFSDSYLKALTENELTQKARELASLALENKVALAKFTITEEDITGLTSLTDRFEGKVPQPRQTVSVRVSAKISLNKLIRTNSVLLKEELDGLVDIYRRKNPDFWNAYFTARKLVNYGVRHEKKEEGTGTAASKN